MGYRLQIQKWAVNLNFYDNMERKSLKCQERLNSCWERLCDMTGNLRTTTQN